MGPWWESSVSRISKNFFNSFKDYFVNVPSQWEMTLHCNVSIGWVHSQNDSCSLQSYILVTPYGVIDLGQCKFRLWLFTPSASFYDRHFPYWVQSAATGARNSSLGHPNMAEALLGKNFPKVIPSLLHIFNGWYLQHLVIWCVSLSRPQNIWCKRPHITRRRGDISSRDARISTFV